MYKTAQQIDRIRDVRLGVVSLGVADEGGGRKTKGRGGDFSGERACVGMRECWHHFESGRETEKKARMQGGNPSGCSPGAQGLIGCGKRKCLSRSPKPPVGSYMVRTREEDRGSVARAGIPALGRLSAPEEEHYLWEPIQPTTRVQTTGEQINRAAQLQVRRCCFDARTLHAAAGARLRRRPDAAVRDGRSRSSFGSCSPARPTARLRTLAPRRRAGSPTLRAFYRAPATPAVPLGAVAWRGPTPVRRHNDCRFTWRPRREPPRRAQ